jgi:hypothetical protein
MVPNLYELLNPTGPDLRLCTNPRASGVCCVRGGAKTYGLWVPPLEAGRTRRPWVARGRREKAPTTISGQDTPKNRKSGKRGGRRAPSFDPIDPRKYPDLGAGRCPSYKQEVGGSSSSPPTARKACRRPDASTARIAPPGHGDVVSDFAPCSRDHPSDPRSGAGDDRNWRRRTHVVHALNVSSQAAVRPVPRAPLRPDRVPVHPATRACSSGARRRAWRLWRPAARPSSADSASPWQSPPSLPAPLRARAGRRSRAAHHRRARRRARGRAPEPLRPPR